MYKPNSTTRYGSGPGDPAWEEQSRRWVGDALTRFPTKLNEADIVALRDKTFATRGLSLTREADVLYVADKMLADFMNKPPVEWEFTSVRAAFEKAKQLASEYNAVGLGAQREIFKRGKEIECNFADPYALDAIIVHLGTMKKPFFELSESGKREKQESENRARVLLERDRLIASILNGKSTYPKWDPREGKVMPIDAHALDSKTNEELAVIEGQVSELRRLQGSSREDRRQGLQVVADANKEHRLYRRGDKDSLDTDASPTKWDSDDQSPIVGRVDARNYSKNEKVVVGDTKSAAPTDPFISPASGREYNKKEIYNIARNDLKLFRELMKKDNARLNRIIN